MAKKKFKFLFDSPVSIIFVLLTVAVFVADIFLKGKITELACTCRSMKVAENAFNIRNPMDYVRVLAHVFGNENWNQILINSTIMLLLGTTLEERYGSKIVTLMAIIASVVSGVLTVCAPPMMNCGADSILFMFIILASLTALAKKTVSFSWLLVFAAFTAQKIYTLNNEQIFARISYDSGFMQILQNNLPVFISLAGGLCGSLLGFLIAPKSSKTQRVQETSWNSDDTLISDDNKKHSRRKSSKSSSSDATIIGNSDF